MGASVRRLLRVAIRAKIVAEKPANYSCSFAGFERKGRSGGVPWQTVVGGFEESVCRSGGFHRSPLSARFFPDVPHRQCSRGAHFGGCQESSSPLLVTLNADALRLPHCVDALLDIGGSGGGKAGFGGASPPVSPQADSADARHEPALQCNRDHVNSHTEGTEPMVILRRRGVLTSAHLAPEMN